MPRLVTEATLRLIKISAIAAVMFVAASMILAGSASAQETCGSGNALGPSDLACGDSAFAGSLNGPALGATAIGHQAVAISGGTSVGDGAGGDLFGVGANTGATSIGANANGSLSLAGLYSTAIGAGALTGGVNHAAISQGDFSVAIGGGGDGTTGLGAQSSGDRSIAIGINSASAGASSMAIGSGASAIAANAVAIGNTATAIGSNSIAGGNNAQATGASAVAIGDGATAGFANSTAIGSGATVTAANQVAIGTASNTYRLAGVASAASLAAQSGPVSFVTTDAAGNLATSSFNPANLTSLQSQFTSLQSQVTSLQSQVMDNRLEARSGTAVALAAGSMPALQPGRKFALSAGYGNFEGANAFALGATALLYDGKSYAVIANAGGGIGLERNVAGGRGAVSIQW